MNLITKTFITLAGCLHILIFVMESILFANQAVYSRFLITSAEHASMVELFAYNQGWYNLFLAIAAIVGVILSGKWIKHVGETLAVYACLSMLGAAVVLVFSAPDMARAAFIQGLFPMIALGLFMISVGRKAKSQ
jgi:putative membrane protein